MAVCVPVKCHPVCAGFFCPETLTGERRRPPVDDHSYTNFLRNQAITIPPISSHRIQPKCFKWPAISEGICYTESSMFARWMCCADKSKIWPHSWELVTMGQSCRRPTTVGLTFRATSVVALCNLWTVASSSCRACSRCTGTRNALHGFCNSSLPACMLVCLLREDK